MVIHDNDGGDCMALKQVLRSLCEDAGRDDVLVRIACQELEAWYLGEPDALAEAFDDEALRGLGRRARFRDPDAVIRPSAELERLVPAFQKIAGARRIAGYLNPERNRSPSFHALMRGLEPVATELLEREKCGVQA